MHGKLKAGVALVILLFVGLFGPYISCAADRKAVINLDVRYRWEFQDNFNQKYYGKKPPKGSSDDGFLLQRIRLICDLHPIENIHFSLGMQDSRAYDVALPDKAFYKPGLDLEHNPYKDYCEPFDTYVEIKNLLGRSLSVKAGRQTIRYGDNRIFGPGQWGNTGRYIWDVVKLSYKFSKNFLDIFYGANIIHDPHSFSLNYRHFYEGLAFYSHFLLPLDTTRLYLEPFFARKWNDHKNYKGEGTLPGEFWSNFYGFRSYAELPYGLDYDFTFVWQRGNLGDDDIDAYAFHVLGGHTFRKADWTPRISAEFSYASGDDNPKDGERGTFGGVFGARDKMYGRMNLMDWENLRDAQINLQLNPAEKLSFKAELHKF